MRIHFETIKLFKGMTFDSHVKMHTMLVSPTILKFFVKEAMIVEILHVNAI